MPNTNFQTFHQMGNAINNVVKQATGRDAVQNIDMDFVTVAQRKRVVEEIITGNPASFVTNISEPIDHLIVQIDAVQSGSGDPSPENVRPISGWTGVNISHSGEDSSSPTVYSISFSEGAGTVYFGELNVTTGLLTATWVADDMGDLEWELNDSYAYPYFTSKSLNNRIRTSNVLVTMCECYKAIPNIGASTMRSTNAYDKCICYNSGVSTGRMIAQDTSIATAEAFTQSVTGRKIISKLDTAETYQLDPVVIRTLIGLNNLWADTGNVTVMYKNYEEVI